MCGFLIIKDFAEKSIDICANEEQLIKFYLHPRGPYEFNEVNLPGVRAFHARLKIRGGKYGTQPVHNENEIFVYNGELYSLDTKDFSDTQFFFENIEKILNLSVNLDGIFSAAYFDKKKQRVSLIRDRWGTKPLFYSISKERLYACSSLRLLASLLKVTKDMDSINTYNQLGFFYGDSTPFVEIKKVKPGGISNFFLKENEIYKNFKSFSSNKEIFSSNSIENALKSQLISDVPVGLLLSGGVDSSILAHHMSKFTDSIFF